MPHQGAAASAIDGPVQRDTRRKDEAGQDDGSGTDGRRGAKADAITHERSKVASAGIGFDTPMHEWD